MGKIFIFFLLANSKNYCQKLTREPLKELQKEYLSDESIVQGPKRIRNPDLSGTLPQQVLIRVRFL